MPEDYYLDKQQREYLLKDLATLLEHIHDLDNVLTRQTRYHGQGRNSAETPHTGDFPAIMAAIDRLTTLRADSDKVWVLRPVDDEDDATRPPRNVVC